MGLRREVAESENKVLLWGPKTDSGNGDSEHEGLE